jgi:ABC-type antimicrobial peptide transport system permease subunit
MDEDKSEDLETGKPEDAEKTEEKKKPREPTGNDYMAGAILANGIIWLWMQSLTMFSGFTNRIHPSILADFTAVTIVVAGFISSQQVAKRSERNQLIVALRSALYSWAGSLIMMITAPNASITFALILLVCLLAGGILGSYMLIRVRINERKRLLEASS